MKKGDRENLTEEESKAIDTEVDEESNRPVEFDHGRPDLGRKEISLFTTPPARRCVLVIENDTIGNEYWAPTVAKTLREYADLVEAQIAFRGNLCRYQAKNGNIITSLGGSEMFEPFKFHHVVKAREIISQKITEWHKKLAEGPKCTCDELSGSYFRVDRDGVDVEPDKWIEVYKCVIHGRREVEIKTDQTQEQP